MTQVPVIKVLKEELPGMVFSREEVLKDEALRKKRMSDLQKALKAGNSGKLKVKIIFESYNGHLMEVETTVWNVTDEMVEFKGGAHIPVRAIREVRFL